MRVIGSDIPGGIIGHRIELYIICDRCLEGEAS